jgi:hypothetical protein
MTSWKDNPQADEERVVIDVYGIRTRVRPGDLGEPSPSSWSEVRDQLRGHLLRLAVAPTRLLTELFEGVTRLVRGVSFIPDALVTRVWSAHDKVDRDEEKRQLEAGDTTSPSTSLDHSAQSVTAAANTLVERLEVLLHQVRTEGRDGAVVLMRNGSILVILGTPEETRVLIEAAAEEVVLMLSSTDAAASERDVEIATAAMQGALPSAKPAE